MRTTLLLFALLMCASVFGQKAEKVYGPARVHKPMTYYKEQSALWKKEIDQNPKNGEAWYNYYNANRILMFNDKEDKRSMKEKSAALVLLVDDMGKQIPESYEYNLCRYMASDFSEKMVPYLKKAASLGEGRTEHVDFMINVSELSRNIADRDKYSKMKNEVGEMSTGMLNYNYNVLMGLPKNCILITSGDNDTYPAWALQGMGIRKDVTVINLFLIAMDDYRSKVFTELGVEKLEHDHNKTVDENFQDKLLSHLVANKKNFPLAIALTASGCEPYVGKLEKDLYLTGMAYQYSPESIDNLAIMKHNFEQVYGLDYIDKSFYKDIAPEKVGFINLNYLVPMLKLYDHYKISGDTQKRDWIKAKIELIAKESPDAEEVKKHLAQP